MKPVWTLFITTALALSACTFEKNVGDVVAKGGHYFPYVRKSTERALNDTSDNVRYEVTYPDGTKETFHQSSYREDGFAQMSDGIDRWLIANGQAKSVAAPPTSRKTQSSEASLPDTRGD